MKKILIYLTLILFFGSCNSSAYCEDKNSENILKTGINFLNGYEIIDVNIKDPSSLMEWIKKTENEISSLLRNNFDYQDILLQIDLHRERNADIAFSSRPRLNPQLKTQLLNKINKKKLPRVIFVDFSFQIYFRFPYREKYADITFEPVLENRIENSKSLFRSASKAEKLELLKKLAVQIILPVITEYCLASEVQFEGIRNIGFMLRSIDYSQEIDIKSKTVNKYEFWQGVLEQAEGNELIACAQVYLYVANGYIFEAKQLADIIKIFAYKEFASDYFLKELDWRLKYYLKDSEKEKEKTPKNFKNNKYKEFKQMDLENIFKTTHDMNKVKKQILRYADIAFEIEEYGLAAHLYQHIMFFLEPRFYENRDMLSYFLYCLEKLGVTEMKENYRGDHLENFKRIETFLEAKSK
ncbi:MAG: hypothetical protein KAI43_02795 [Candidatus Aureabacteria bacterium]|nr:hypothetical protein [Candidatus Auribacterota bacterium]